MSAEAVLTAFVSWISKRFNQPYAKALGIERDNKPVNNLDRDEEIGKSLLFTISFFRTFPNRFLSFTG
jgi:hypothetical protein